MSVQGFNFGCLPDELRKENKMPKCKNQSSVKKRFRITGKGKVKQPKAAHGHLLISKSKKAKKSAKHMIIANDHIALKVKKFLPMQ